ncbi:hypothetical protein NBRC116602_28360 [Hyphomicrobiales bacterium 4NK60-0047b]
MPKYFDATTRAARINEMMKVTNDGADGLILRPSVNDNYYNNNANLSQLYPFAD